MEADTGTRAFVDLHCHSRFSFDSISPLGRIMATAVSRGLTHLAITDHERIDGALRAREMHADALSHGARVLIHDDLLATGGTAKALCELVEQLGAHVVGLAFVVELEFLRGREKLAGCGEVHSLISYAAQ